jgi:NADH-quinone oxidoreductase subunit G
MEFLLINHPLDCPICDQGGECELQDLAMGYGRSVSRFSERKRVVVDKNVGPLIQTDMTRCIQCTRCVRFLDEIAGTDELGMLGRGDRVEIGTFITHSIESELSGNVIDLCPVGALTNKPFLFSARAWELEAKASVAVHDGLGSNLYYHSRRGKVMRAVPRDNDAINEAWISDRDRYSHFGLYAEDRLLAPMIKREGEWQETSWGEALQAASSSLGGTAHDDGGESLGILMSASAFDEEYYLAQKLARSLGCNNIDHRLREQDFRDQSGLALTPRFDQPLEGMEKADALFLIGSNIRHEAPILGHKVRQANRSGAAICVLNPMQYNFHFEVADNWIAAPQDMVACLFAVALAVAEETGTALPTAVAALGTNQRPDEQAAAVARRLVNASNAVIVIGQISMAHDQSAALRQLAYYIADAASTAVCTLPAGGNPAGAWAAGAVPHRSAGGSATDEAGLDAMAMLAQPLNTYLLWDFEPGLDTANAGATLAALAGADTVIAVTPFASETLKAHADILLPLAPVMESEGRLTSLQQDKQSVSAAVAVSGQARPGWKILRQLGNDLGLDGFEFVALAEIRAELDETLAGAPEIAPVAELSAADQPRGLYRLGDVPIYSADGMCRRSAPLQETVHAVNGFINLNPEDAGKLGLGDGAVARISQGDSSAELPVRLVAEIPPGVARLPAATHAHSQLGAAFGPITVTAS